MANHCRRKRLDYFFEKLLLDINFIDNYSLFSYSAKSHVILASTSPSTFKFTLALPFMKGRAKVNLKVEGEVEAKMTCDFAEYENKE